VRMEQGLSRMASPRQAPLGFARDRQDRREHFGTAQCRPGRAVISRQAPSCPSSTLCLFVHSAL
jgi:hypothetical protein